MKDDKVQILIIDLGSQYTQIIRRSLRYLGFHSVIVPPSDALKWINSHHPKGVILSGGSASVYDSDAPEIPKEILTLGLPILGICYGMQWFAYITDQSTVHKVKEGKSYGPVKITFTEPLSKLFAGLPVSINAWSSHGDSVKHAPKNNSQSFRPIATSKDGGVLEGMEDTKNNFYAVQFHPEVEETEDENIILNNFVAKICGCKQEKRM
jgi:GMP synthase (glutamine-hydrolysing)